MTDEADFTARVTSDRRLQAEINPAALTFNTRQFQLLLELRAVARMTTSASFDGSCHDRWTLQKRQQKDSIAGISFGCLIVMACKARKSLKGTGGRGSLAFGQLSLVLGRKTRI